MTAVKSDNADEVVICESNDPAHLHPKPMTTRTLLVGQMEQSAFAAVTT